MDFLILNCFYGLPLFFDATKRTHYLCYYYIYHIIVFWWNAYLTNCTHRK